MEDENPTVGVVLIVKNGDRFIRSALESVFSQDYSPTKIVVVDGKSEDNTLQIVREFEGIKILHQKGSGIYHAFNIGIKACNTSFIALFSSDDLWMPKKLSSQISFMMENPDVLFTNTYFKYFLETGLNPPEGVRKNWLRECLPGRIPETLVARKEVFDIVGYFKNKYSTAEDLDWYSRANDLNVKSYMMKDVLLMKRIHNQNESMQIDMNNKNLLKILRRSVDRKRSHF